MCFACRRCQHSTTMGDKKSPRRISGSATQPKRRHDKGLHNTHQRRRETHRALQVLKPCVGQVHEIPERLSDRVDKRQGRKDRQDSATNQWLFSLLKDRKACRQTLCSKEGNRSANTGSAKERASGIASCQRNRRQREAALSAGKNYTECGSAADGTCQCTDAQELR